MAREPKLKKTTASDYDQTGKKPESKKDPILDEVMGKFNAARSYMKKGFMPTWQDARKLYNSQRIAANYEGNSDTFVPETFTIIQSVKSNVVGGKIAIDFLPTNKDQTGDTKVLKALMDQIWVQDKTKLKASWAIDDSLQVGNGYLWQYVKNNLPYNRYVPTEDNFFDPDATSYEDLRYGGYRYLTTLTDLKKHNKINPDYDEEDPESEMKVSRYKNLDKINGYKTPGKTEDLTAKQLREEMIAGSVLGEKAKDNEEIVEVICYHDKEKIVKVANRCVVIENEDTPFKRESSTVKSVDDQGIEYDIPIPEIKPFIPVAPFRDYVDGAMFYARGEIEIIGDLQELLNDTQNQKTDNLSHALNKMWVLDPSQEDKIDEIQSVPGAVFTVPVNSLQPIQHTNVGPDADIEMGRIQSMMRRATAADEIIQGTTTSGDTTATEINAQIMQAGTRFSSKLENYETEGFTILTNNMFKILQIFLTQEMAVRLIGQKGIEWKDYNPGEYLGDFDVKVQLEATARAMKEEEKQNAMQFFLMAAKLPFINQEVLFKMTVKTLFDKDESDIDGLINPQQLAMMQAMQSGMMPGAPAPGGDMAAMPQQGMGALASAPMSDAEATVGNEAMAANGLNITGMPTA